MPDLTPKKDGPGKPKERLPPRGIRAGPWAPTGGRRAWSCPERGGGKKGSSKRRRVPTGDILSGYRGLLEVRCQQSWQRVDPENNFPRGPHRGQTFYSPVSRILHHQRNPRKNPVLTKKSKEILYPKFSTIKRNAWPPPGEDVCQSRNSHRGPHRGKTCVRKKNSGEDDSPRQQKA